MSLRGLMLTCCIAALANPARASEIEADPAAYALEGYSAHLAHSLDEGRTRLQVGLFAADVPDWLHGKTNSSWIPVASR